MRYWFWSGQLQIGRVPCPASTQPVTLQSAALAEAAVPTSMATPSSAPTMFLMIILLQRWLQRQSVRGAGAYSVSGEGHRLAKGASPIIEGSVNYMRLLHAANAMSAALVAGCGASTATPRWRCGQLAVDRFRPRSAKVDRRRSAALARGWLSRRLPACLLGLELFF